MCRSSNFVRRLREIFKSKLRRAWPLTAQLNLPACISKGPSDTVRKTLTVLALGDFVQGDSMAFL